MDNNQIRIEWTKDTSDWEWITLKRKCFKECVAIIKKEISTRPNKQERFEPWECLDEDKNFNSLEYKRILKSREKLTPKLNKYSKKRKLDYFCKKHNVPDFMGSIFLKEVKLSNDKDNEYLRNDARNLGLIN